MLFVDIQLTFLSNTQDQIGASKTRLQQKEQILKHKEKDKEVHCTTL